MSFQEALEQTLTILRRQGRVSCRALKREFGVDDGFIDDLQAELTQTLRLAELHDGVLVLRGGAAPELPDAPAAPAGDAQRRQLTVMFCDVADAAALAARLDAEDLHAILRDYQAVVAGAVERMGGHVAQYLGDGMLVYFGFPQAHDDDARRAVGAGLDIITGLGPLRTTIAARHGERFAVRLGVHTGPVVMGELGAGTHHEQLAVGDTPNIAARVQALAEPDTLLVSAPTWRLLDGWFIGEPRGEHTLEGLAQPMTVVAVTAASGAQSRLDAARGELTPLVGRDSEQRLLRERWAQVRRGDGQVLLLAGEPGIGKSRLALLMQELAAADGATVLRFRCSPYRVSSAFWPLTEALAAQLKFGRDDSGAARLAKLQQALPALSAPATVALPLIARLLSLPLDGLVDDAQALPAQQQRSRTQDLLAEWMLKAAEHAPLLVVWEDLHWADPSTLEFIGLLIEQLPMARAGMLLTFRPEFDPPWGARSYVSRLTLDRLTKSEMESMIERIVHRSGLPGELVRQVVARTDGVPLFVEELVKSIVESGLVADDGVRLALTGPLPELAIPTTLQDSLMARLDRLAGARDVAQIAAAIGREFSHEMLAAVSQLGEVSLQQGLRQLIDGEIIYRRGQAASAGYAFKHALIRDAAYQSLLKSRRHLLHQRIAQVLAERFPDIVANEPELPAHHLYEAGLAEAAIVHWQRAAQRAIERSANSEGIAHLKRALDALPLVGDPVARAQRELELRVALGVPLIATRGYADAEVERTYARASELARQVGTTPQLPHIVWGLWVFHLCGGTLGAALAMGEQHGALAQAEPQDDALRLETCQLLGIAHFYRGEFVPALAHLQAGARLYDAARHHALIFAHGGADTGVAICSHAALTQWMLGDEAGARASMQRAMAIAHQVQHPFSLAFAHYFRAWGHALAGETAAAFDAASAARAICDQYGFPFWGLASAVLRGAMNADAQAGVAEMTTQLAAYSAIGAALHAAPLRGLLAAALQRAGDAVGALQQLQAALAALPGRDERWYESRLHQLHGELLRSAGDDAGARAAFERARECVRKQREGALP